MNEYAVKIIEYREQIVLIPAESLAESIMKVQNLYDNNKIQLLSDKADVQISGYNAIPETIEELKNDKNVINLLDNEPETNLEHEYE